MTPPPGLLHVEQALQDVAALVAHGVAHKGLTLAIRIQPETPLIPIDRANFKTICYNLLGCAVNVAPEAGHVLVAAGPASDGEASGKPALVCVVSENSDAIAEDDPERLARGYEQLDERPNGQPRTQSGRLLASTRRLVESLGGTIRVMSLAGKGNSMTIVLPIGSGPALSVPGS